MDDGALITATRDGDERAFAELVHRHTPALYRVALHLLGTPADAEDCVQDCWLTAWRGLDRFRGDAAVGTWLYRIATNAALMQARRRRNTVGLHQIADRPDETADPDRLAAGIAVRQALLQLPIEQRTVVVLREYGGLTYEELAAALDLTVPAARSRLHRARLTLTVLLEDPR